MTQKYVPIAVVSKDKMHLVKYNDNKENCFQFLVQNKKQDVNHSKVTYHFKGTNLNVEVVSLTEHEMRLKINYGELGLADFSMRLKTLEFLNELSVNGILDWFPLDKSSVESHLEKHSNNNQKSISEVFRHINFEKMTYSNEYLKENFNYYSSSDTLKFNLVDESLYIVTAAKELFASRQIDQVFMDLAFILKLFKRTNISDKSVFWCLLGFGKFVQNLRKASVLYKNFQHLSKDIQVEYAKHKLRIHCACEEIIMYIEHIKELEDTNFDAVKIYIHKLSSSLGLLTNSLMVLAEDIDCLVRNIDVQKRANHQHFLTHAGLAAAGLAVSYFSWGVSSKLLRISTSAITAGNAGLCVWYKIVENDIGELKHKLSYMKDSLKDVSKSLNLQLEKFRDSNADNLEKADYQESKFVFDHMLSEIDILKSLFA